MTNVRLKLTFPEHLIKQPIIARMVQEFGVMPNIRRASVEEHFGWMVCELGGESADVERAVEWLTQLGIQVDRADDTLEG